MNTNPYAIKILCYGDSNTWGQNYDQKSWTTKPFSYNGFEADSLDWRLDYVFGSKDIKVESSEMLNTQFSDHLPIVVVLDLA